MIRSISSISTFLKSTNGLLIAWKVLGSYRVLGLENRGGGLSQPPPPLAWGVGAKQFGMGRVNI